MFVVQWPGLDLFSFFRGRARAAKGSGWSGLWCFGMSSIFLARGEGIGRGMFRLEGFLLMANALSG